MENNCFATGITFPARSEVLRMRNQTPSHYCLQTIRREDLKRLAEIAHHDVDQYFGRKSSMKRTYQTRFLCSALCQGAAIHFALPKYEYGIKDFDVWTFFAQATKGTPLGMFKRRATTVEFGKPRFDGKHVDTLMAHHQRIGKRSCSRGTQDWLSGNSASAKALRRKAIVFLDPPEFRGRIIWLLGNCVDSYRVRV